MNVLVIVFCQSATCTCFYYIYVYVTFSVLWSTYIKLILCEEGLANTCNIILMKLFFFFCSANILLGANMEAKVCDFGLAHLALKASTGNHAMILLREFSRRITLTLNKMMDSAKQISSLYTSTLHVIIRSHIHMGFM